MNRLHLDLSWEEEGGDGAGCEMAPEPRGPRRRPLLVVQYIRPTVRRSGGNETPSQVRVHSDWTEAHETRVKDDNVRFVEALGPVRFGGTKVEVNGKTVAIFKYDGGFYAIQDACPHQAASLHLGDIEDIDGTLCISCPQHKWPFSLEDGQCIIPVNRQAECYPIRVRRERDGSKILYIGFSSITDTLFHDDSF
uniref:Rieske domain-containing protein n=1 Tax=Phytophthora ramorum TaxID=164328 RepID=H3GCB6_PHYRM